MLRNIGLLLLSIVLSLAICEGLLRVLADDLLPEPDLYYTDPDVGKRMRPGWSGGEFGTAVKINSKGLRNREVDYERSEGVFRILALGDSWTFGYRLDEPESYPRQLEAILNQSRGARQPFEVINAGVIGYSTAQEAAFLRIEGHRYQPDLVVVGFYPVNDTHHKLAAYERHTWLRDIHPWLLDLYEFPKRLVLREFWRGTRKGIKRWLSQARVGLAARLGYTDRAAQAVLDDDWTVSYGEGNRGWELAAGALEQMGVQVRQMGARGLVVLLPDVLDLARYEDTYHPRIAPLVAARVEKAGLDLLDLAEVFSPYRGREAEIRFGTERHPNAAGYRLIAQAIAARILRDYAEKP